MFLYLKYILKIFVCVKQTKILFYFIFVVMNFILLNHNFYLSHSFDHYCFMYMCVQQHFVFLVVTYQHVFDIVQQFVLLVHSATKNHRGLS